MGLSHKIKATDLRAGDHVYCWRRCYLFAHHGIYVGNNTIVDFNRGNGKSGPGASSGSKGPGKVRKCSLEEFLENGSLRRYKYGVSKGYFKTRRGGTCTTAISDDPATVIHRANYILANDVFGKYKMFSNNCENFALYCKTGLVVDHEPVESSLRSSGQAAGAAAAAAAAVISIPIVLRGGQAAVAVATAATFISIPIVLSGVTAASLVMVFITGGLTCALIPLYLVYAWNKSAKMRYQADIGVRKDAKRVEVEDLNSGT